LLEHVAIGATDFNGRFHPVVRLRSLGAGDTVSLAKPQSATSLGEHDAPALDLLPVEPHQPLAMWTVDRKIAGYGKPEIRIAAAESRLLECDQSGALWIAAPDRQIPVDRTGEIFDRELWAVRLMHSDSCRGRRAPAVVI
jgi:hypothetical protein